LISLVQEENLKTKPTSIVEEEEEEEGDDGVQEPNFETMNELFQ